MANIRLCAINRPWSQGRTFPNRAKLPIDKNRQLKNASGGFLLGCSDAGMVNGLNGDPARNIFPQAEAAIAAYAEEPRGPSAAREALLFEKELGSQPGLFFFLGGFSPGC